jgi:hypothetical protein
VARYCPRCGQERYVASAGSRHKRSTFAGFFFGSIVIFAVFGHVFRLFSTGILIAPIAEMTSVATSDGHANEPWWDPSQPDHLKANYFGQAYVVGPNDWTPIDVRIPPGSRRYRYAVQLEGIPRFAARPDGEAAREYIYPSPGNRQPYQISGECQSLWVKSLDDTFHDVRVKYVRRSNSDVR